jgi:hypothetical protein
MVLHVEGKHENNKYIYIYICIQLVNVSFGDGRAMLHIVFEWACYASSRVGVVRYVSNRLLMGALCFTLLLVGALWLKSF